MPAIPNATYAIVLRAAGSWILFNTFKSILFYEVSKNTTPNDIIAAKYRTMTVITKHPPQARMKNNRITDNMRVMKITERDIGQVCFKSDID